jgi:putative transposase
LARHAPTGAAFGKPVAGSVGTVIGAFKSAVTKRINELRGTPGAAVWQRNYFERIVRDERELANIRFPVQVNPERRASDRENPERTADHDPESWE